MPILTLPEMKTALPRHCRLLGLDLGSKTIGLALSDVMATIATPMETIKRTKFTKDAITLASIIKDQNVGGLVLGLPVEMDGSEGARCQSTRQFATNLGPVFADNGIPDIALSFWDERLSTVAVERVLINEADMTRKRRADVVDKAAAAWILQGALDALAHLSSDG